MALFKRRLIQKVRSGEKNQTRRTHKRIWKLGRIYSVRDNYFGKPLGHIKIIKKFKQKLGEISLADVKKEGFNSLEEFRKAWEEINGKGSWVPEQLVTVYEFELAGDLNPQTARI